MPVGNPVAIADRLAGELDAAGVPYAIGGAICLAVWGVPRATKDVDINIFVDERNLDPALAAFTRAGCTFVADEARRRAALRGDMVLYDGDTRVDVFVAFHPIHAEIERRRVRAPLPTGREVHVLAARDLVLFKVLFDRAKDWLDIERLAIVQGADLDGDALLADLASLLDDDPRIARLRGLIEKVRGTG